MFTIVFSKEDKDNLISNGGIFIKEQLIGDKVTYVFQNINNIKDVNFETNKIKYINTNDMLF